MISGGLGQNRLSANKIAKHAEITQSTGVAIYFADPHSPLAAGLEREYQRFDPPVPAQEHGLVGT